ncbi:MAG TPA: acyl-CoA dehydrogenase C-terminal domain-containing protein, partial [Sphingomicrobium sp.]|nr:acyl-CoA dehydrogenase C-terminal domain-containing protein [Sphingomicrobium sp.]
AQHGMANPDDAGAGAYAYMDLMGLVTLGWMWLKMARAASQALAAGGGKEGREFYEAKLTIARFYAQRELPLTVALRRKVEAGAETLMAMPAEAF